MNKKMQGRKSDIESARVAMQEARDNMNCLTSLLSCTFPDNTGKARFLLNDRTRAMMAQTIEDNLVMLKGGMAKLS